MEKERKYSEVNPQLVSTSVLPLSHSLYISPSPLSHSKPLGRGVEPILAPPPNHKHMARPTAYPPWEEVSLSLSLCLQIHSLSLSITNLSLPLVVLVSLYVGECGLCPDCADSLYESRSTTAIAMKQEEHLLDLKTIYSSSLSFSLSLILSLNTLF